MELFPLLYKVKNGSISVIELNSLIKYSISIAILIIRKKIETTGGKFAHLGLSPEEVAVDAVSPLFLRSSGHCSPVIKISLERWLTPINNESHAHFFIYKVVSNRIEQEIIKKLREADPFYGKILDSINYALIKSDYTKVTYFSESYIITKSSNTIGGKIISSEEFNSLPSHLFSGKVVEQLNKLIFYLENHTDNYPAIPINLLIVRLKHQQLDSMPLNFIIDSEQEYEEIQSVSYLVNLGLDAALKQLNKYHLLNGKINDEFVKFYEATLLDLAVDLKNGGLNRSLFDYFSTHATHVTKQEFYSFHHSTIDYLLRTMKDKIKTKLQNKVQNFLKN